VSMEDIDLIRQATGSMFIYTYILLKDNVSIPAKEAAKRLLLVFLDQVLSKKKVEEALKETAKFMEWMRYPAPDLHRLRDDRRRIHDSARQIVIEYLRRGEDEDVLEYYRRVGLFITRLLVYYRLSSDELLLEMMI